MRKNCGLILLSMLVAACGGPGGGGGSNDQSGGSDYVTDNRDCTHIISDGIYSTPVNSGSYPPGSLVCAENDGQVVFTGPFNPSGYSMRGFVVASADNKSVSNGTFERMSFVGGPACGNNVNTSAGSNTIIRDSAFFGQGGRYLLLAYQSSDVQITNAIFRVDGGWGETNPCNEFEPNAALNIYDTNNAICDGCINIDQNPTAASNSEFLGGLGINAHSNNLCYSVEIRNSVDYNAGGFWSAGNGQCNPLYTNLKGDLNFNLSGTTTVSDTTADNCNSWNGPVTRINSDISSGNCSSSGAGVALNLDTEFLNDSRWRSELCGIYGGRSDGWCATSMLLSEYISQ